MKPILVYALVAIWPDVGLTREPATTLVACEVAAEAATAGRGLPLYTRSPALLAWCAGPMPPAQAGFQPGWDTVRGYNDR